jgi:hypothetical protein
VICIFSFTKTKWACRKNFTAGKFIPIGKKYFFQLGTKRDFFDQEEILLKLSTGRKIILQTA